MGITECIADRVPYLGRLCYSAIVLSGADPISTATLYPHLTTDANGIVRISGGRYKVRHLAAEHYQHGWSAEELLRQHLDLRPEEVYSALTYFYDHYETMVAELKADAAAVEAKRPSHGLSREELLKRSPAQGK